MSKFRPIKLLVGLGNPGNEYNLTRHNAGYWLLDEIINRYENEAVMSEESKFHGEIGKINTGENEVRVLRSNLFMNQSGQSVSAVANFYKIKPDEILIAHDELDLLPGTIRLKMGGGHGGHNGLRDIISCLGNQNNFGRIRIGIGHPGNSSQVSNFVLKKPPVKEQCLIQDSIDELLRHINKVLKGEWQDVMNHIHGFNASAQEIQE